MWQTIILAVIGIGLVAAISAPVLFMMSSLRTLPRPLMLTQAVVCGLTAVTMLRMTQTFG